MPLLPLNSKADKVIPASAGNLAALDGDGNIYDSGSAGGSVASVFGRIGVVVAASGDYSAFFDPINAAAAVQSASLQKSSNLSDLVSASTARTNLGLGTAATHASTDFDLSGAATTAQTNAEAYASNASNLSSGTISNALLSAIPNTALAGFGVASGIATLDGGGKLASAQIPASLVGALQYQGTWNANTNSPTLVSSTGTKGQYYKVATAGATTIDGISQWNVGDTIVFDGTVWDKIDGIANEVITVFGRYGVVTAQSGDYSAFYDTVGAAATAQAASLQKSANLSDLANLTTARANLGLGTAATHAYGDFDPSGAASTAQGNAITYANVFCSPIAGSSSIVTVGTVTSGTWAATPVAIAYGGTGQSTGSAAFAALVAGTVMSAANGGTGVNNSGTLTLPANLALSGTGNTTLTVTGATNVTLPTTGTLATLGANSFSGNQTITGRVSATVSLSSPFATLTFGTTLATDGSTGSNFQCTLTNNFTLSAPTNPVDGQIFRWRLIQDATGGRTVTLGTGFNLGSDLSAITLSTAASKTDYLTAIYRSSTGKFDVTGFLRGF